SLAVIIDPFDLPAGPWRSLAMPARRSVTTLRLSVILSLASLLIIQFAAPAWAWGRIGHRAIAKLAERHLSPAAKPAIAELLELGESLADASTYSGLPSGCTRE